MILIDWLFGRPKDFQRDEMCDPIAEELEEAPVHAAICARRYEKIQRGVFEVAQEVRSSRIVLFFLILLVAISNIKEALALIEAWVR